VYSHFKAQNNTARTFNKVFKYFDEQVS